ncbi:TRAP transporter substrate-binding protein DctP [Paracoccus thiocyanatus]|uniref:C4-dicarboxylate ABC transporter substrate-binding protein n=1 Tax=Paracoccus thiocyanatus TaxID=34006 RepID=A0A1N6V6B1_9RHOB|nr:TRAP transporter substrate-binding protein DctP [Paracoccus thiocyanatus]RDW13769.1 C4-dicarboxylate ABC transporter substrate-binding protein [Paracoccus thiocyanatus]SIQ73385.1 TRAP-type C4-dicarboxylate transport system, substrate-binding protein [Paracoccus thiocyanatus]
MKYAGYLLGAVLVAGGAASSAQAQQAILGHIMDSEHIFHHVSERFMERLDELSGGSFAVDYHPGGDLGDWTSITEQVAQGAVQMTMTYNHSELDPRWDLSVLGYVASDWDAAQKIYGPGSVMEGVYAGIMNDLGMELLGIIPTDFAGFIVRKGKAVPVNFPEDAAGMKMRVPGMPMAIERYNALGFSPVPMAFSEVHTALQTGAIDGRAYSPPVEVPMFSDVLEAYVFTREHFEHTFWVANKAWFDGLTDEQRGWLTEAADEAVSGSWELAQSQSAKWLAEIEAGGVDVVELTPEQQEKHRALVIEAEYPYMENIVGAEIMDQIRAAAGTN